MRPHNFISWSCHNSSSVASVSNRVIFIICKWTFSLNAFVHGSVGIYEYYSVYSCVHFIAINHVEIISCSFRYETFNNKCNRGACYFVNLLKLHVCSLMPVYFCGSWLEHIKLMLLHEGRLHYGNSAQRRELTEVSGQCL